MAFQFDITNPLHYTVANNYSAVCQLITGKYQMPAPNGYGEAVQACQVALDMKGERFAQDIAMLHPDKDVLLSAAGHYGSCCGNKSSFSAPSTDMDNRTLEELKNELAKQEALLAAGNFATEADKKAVVDNIEYLKALIAKKLGQATSPKPGEGPATDKDNTNKSLFIFGIIALSILAISKK